MQRLVLVSLVLITLAACSGKNTSESSTSVASADATPALVGTLWQWQSTVTPVERIDVREPARYSLRLIDDGNAEIQFDCNRGRGNFALEGNQLSFGPLMSTRMACTPDSQDAVFMNYIGRVSTWFMQDGDLYLELPYDSGTMRFSRASDER